MRLRRFLMFSLLAVVLGAVLAGAGYWAYWNFYARFRPVLIAKNTAEIERLLDQAGWVAPNRTGPYLYMITYRACAECARYQREEFPKLAEANVDTRVITFARADADGVPQSAPSERSTVAELWINRDWNLYLNWMATPRQSWTAPGLRRADGDFARTAVVDASRQFLGKLEPLLAANGLSLRTGYPILIWRDRDGQMKACACTDTRTYRFVRQDLGVADEKPRFIALPLPEPEPDVSEAPDTVPAAPAAQRQRPDPLATPTAPIPYNGKGSPPPPPAKKTEPAPGTQPTKPSDSSNIFY